MFEGLFWKMLIHVIAIWNILRTFGIFYDHLAHFVFIWYIFSGFGIMYQKNLATVLFMWRMIREGLATKN
jgi:hypothetical protein